MRIICEGQHRPELFLLAAIFANHHPCDACCSWHTLHVCREFPLRKLGLGKVSRVHKAADKLTERATRDGANPASRVGMPGQRLLFPKIARCESPVDDGFACGADSARIRKFVRGHVEGGFPKGKNGDGFTVGSWLQQTGALCDQIRMFLRLESQRGRFVVDDRGGAIESRLSRWREWTSMERPQPRSGWKGRPWPAVRSNEESQPPFYSRREGCT
jgi:hypothetical protein